MKVRGCRTFFLLAFCLLWCALSDRAWAANAYFENISAADLPAVSAALRSCGYTLSGHLQTPGGAGDICIYKATDKQPLSAQLQSKLEAFVRDGGAMLLTVDRSQEKAALDLASMLPVVAWQTQAAPVSADARLGPVFGKLCRPSFLTSPALEQRVFEPLFLFRPVTAVERGEQRYQKFARKLPFTGTSVPAGNTFWTRPLVNHNWAVRLVCNDVAHTPLVISGDYGAGKVVLTSFDIASVQKPADVDTLWLPIVRYMPSARVAGESDAADFCAIDDMRAERNNHAAQVTVTSRGGKPIFGKLLSRIFTWEGAYLADSEVEVQITPGKKSSYFIPLPKPGDTNYQALGARDHFIVRACIFDKDMKTCSNELERRLDLSPSLSVDVTTDDIRAVAPLSGPPGPGPLGMDKRLGMKVSNYAYRPGAVVTLNVAVRSCLRNLAPYAVADDQTESSPNASAFALNDLAALAERQPIDGIEAYGCWQGTAGKPNTLTFTFDEPKRISQVDLIGAADNYRGYLAHNPSKISVAADGKTVVPLRDVKALFAAGGGRLSLPFTPAECRQIVVTVIPDQSQPWLAEVELLGADTDEKSTFSGDLAVRVQDTLHKTTVFETTQALNLGLNEQKVFSFPLQLSTDYDAINLFACEATLAESKGRCAFAVLPEGQALDSVSQLTPADSANLGFNVTAGFRNVFSLATGTAERSGGWSSPDDLIYAYERQLKEIRANQPAQASKLFCAQSDFRHYSTCWCSFLNGQYFFDIAAPLIVERLQQEPDYKKNNSVTLYFVDRWDLCPNVDVMYGWAQLTEFDKYLRQNNLTPLKGLTLAEISADVRKNHEDDWQRWHLQRYVRGVHELRQGFAADGKNLVIRGQNIPMLPLKVETDIAKTVAGMNDDCTWGMIQDDPVLTLGRQLGRVALNPDWRLSTLLMWGYDSATLENQHFHTAVGTTEPTVRTYYDRAWRGKFDSTGNYRSVYTYGYSQNAGPSFTMSDNDWQQWFNLEERHSLIYPTAPIGAGLVVGTDRFEQPPAFSYWSETGRLSDARAITIALKRLQSVGVSLPFATNVHAIENAKDLPGIVVLNLCHLSSAELASLQALKARGVPIAAFAGGESLSPAAASIFGTKQIIAGGRTVTVQPGTLLVSGAADVISPLDAAAIAPYLLDVLKQRITFPDGTDGYGFEANGRKWIVVCDRAEVGRRVDLTWRATKGKTVIKACTLTDHSPVEVRQQGDDWILTVPLRPGGAEAICIDES